MTEPVAGDNFAARLEALKVAYSEALPEKLRRIHDMWASLRTLRKISPDLVRPVRDDVHKLAGSGASYGFSALTNLMQRLEQKLDQLTEFPEDQQRLVVEIDSLMRYADKVAHPDAHVGSDESMSGQKRQRPDQPRLLFVAPAGSPLMRLPEQIRHFGYDVFHCEPAQVPTQFDKFQPDIVLYSEREGLPSPAPLDLSRDRPPIVIGLRANPDLIARVEAYRKGVREVLPETIEVAELIERLDGCFVRPVDSPYRVLIVDDDPDVTQYHRELLEQAHMEVRVASEVPEVQETLSEFKPDVVLMDLHLADFNGIELAAALRQDTSLKQVPIVFASVAQDLASHMGAIRAGGDDVLIKPVAPAYLAASLEARARRGRELKDLLHHDGLTGLLNHRTTEELLQQAVARADRVDGELVVVMIDLDHFKQVNDQHGHLVGDRVLSNFARFLRGRMRRSDIVGRYGGEEFMLVLVDTNMTTARAVVESLRVSFATFNHRPDEQPLNVTFSAGLAAYPMFTLANALIRAADRALYRAKHQGRNRVVLADPEILEDGAIHDA